MKFKSTFLILLLVCLYSSSSFGQCSPCAACTTSTSSACTYSVTANSSTSYTVNTGEKLCVISGTYTGSISLKGGIVVVEAGAIFNPSSISTFASPGGSIEIHQGATANLPSITMNTSAPRFFNLNNCGNTTVKSILNNGSALMKIMNGGTMTVTGSFTFNGGGSPLLCNSDSLFLNGLTINGTFTGVQLINSGYIEDRGNWTQNGTDEVDICAGSLIRVFGSYVSNGSGTVTRGLGDCAKIEAGANSTCNGCKMLGIMDFCDTTGSAGNKTYPTPKIDSYLGGGIAPTVTSCTDCKIPVAPISVAVTGGAICEGTCKALTAIVTNGVQPFSYAWTPSIVSSSAEVQVCPTTTTIYTVIVTDANGNTATDTALVTVYPLPTVTFAPFTQPVCEGDAAFLLTGGSPAGGVYSGPGVSNNMFDPKVTGVGTFTLTYIFTTDRGCVDSAHQTITVNPRPTVTVSAQPDPTLPCLPNYTIYLGYGPQAITLTATSTPPATSYQWFLNGVAIQGATNQSYPATATGNYNVIGYVNGCGSDSSLTNHVEVHVVDARCKKDLSKIYVCHKAGNSGKFTDLCVDSSGVAGHLSHGDCLGACGLTWKIADDGNIAANIQFTVHPNPFSGTAMIEFNAPIDMNVTIELSSVNGAVVQTMYDGMVSDGMNSIAIDGTNLPEGIYIATINAAGAVQHQKLILTK